MLDLAHNYGHNFILFLKVKYDYMKLNVNVATTSKFIRIATLLLLVRNETYEYGALKMACHSFPHSIKELMGSEVITEF